MQRLAGLPLLLVLTGVAAGSMYLPAAHALILREHQVARAFFYSGTVILLLTAMIALAVAGHRPRNAARSLLGSLAGAYLILPVLMAVPFVQAVPDTAFTNAWFEMLSSFTTTGATLYPPERLPQSVHLWRALAGWGGGFFAMLMAVAVLAPLNLGGVEVVTGRPPGRGAIGAAQITHVAHPGRRVIRYAALLFPAYGAVTLVLWIGLVMAGEFSFVALCHAMGTISTSGISPVGGLMGAHAGLTGEALIFLCLFPAVTRRALPGAVMVDRSRRWWHDPEVRVAAAIVATATAAVFLRHWVMVIELREVEPLTAALRSVWGAAFTALSFLTTTGFESRDWVTARAWSGLGTPGLMLLGLAITGGGVATAAGGVKLLRIYALSLHAQRELERIVHPSSVSGRGPMARRLRGEGAYVAWIFFMLFAISIAAVTAAMAIVMPTEAFDKLLVLAIAGLTTTGQLANVAADAPIFYADLTGAAKTILGLAMVVGRLETLAILALVAPDGWRRVWAEW
ncbi:MAG: potassium transporter TrkG [Paracoccaceae bacterium]